MIYLLESKHGWKVVYSKAEYGKLNKSNFIVLEDGLTYQQAIDLIKRL